MVYGKEFSIDLSIHGVVQVANLKCRHLHLWIEKKCLHETRIHKYNESHELPLLYQIFNYFFYRFNLPIIVVNISLKYLPF